MVRNISSERLIGAVQQAGLHRETHRDAEGGPRPAFTITLSREAGAGGAEIARMLGERLGWPVYDRELLQKVSEEMGLRAHLLEAVDEKRPGWLHECLQAFAGSSSVSRPAYVHHLIETVLSLGAQGECIIVGRAAAQILPPATTLRVRLVASKEYRIAHFGQCHGLSQEEAVKRVQETDRERTRFVQDYFFKDPADPRNYDLVLNSSRLSMTDCVELIAETLRRIQVSVPARVQ